MACRVDANVVQPGHLARIVLGSAHRVQTASVPINRTPSTGTDSLVHPFVVGIDYVRAVDTIYAAADYSLVTNSNPNLPFAPDSLLWLGGTKPADSTSYGVTYRYRPLFNLLMNAGALALTGSDGLAMPITCVFDRVPVGG